MLSNSKAGVLGKAWMDKRGLELEADYGLTRRCHGPVDDAHPCGQRDACRPRVQGFAAAGVVDPPPQRCIGGG